MVYFGRRAGPSNPFMGGNFSGYWGHDAECYVPPDRRGNREDISDWEQAYLDAIVSLGDAAKESDR